MNVQIAFHGVESDPRLEALIREQVDKLERFHGRITSCRVVVEQPHRSRESNPSWEVRIDLHVPPQHVLVVRQPSREAPAKGDAIGTVYAAFEAAKSRLRRLKERQDAWGKGQPRGGVGSPDRGVVQWIGEDHGFVRALDGREVYFHRNSVLEDRFDELRVGSGVSFAEEMGREGPQASSLRVEEAHPKP